MLGCCLLNDLFLRMGVGCLLLVCLFIILSAALFGAECIYLTDCSIVVYLSYRLWGGSALTSASQNQDQVWVEAKVVASLDVWIVTLRLPVLLAELFLLHNAEILNQNIVFEEYLCYQKFGQIWNSRHKCNLYLVLLSHFRTEHFTLYKILVLYLSLFET